MTVLSSVTQVASAPTPADAAGQAVHRARRNRLLRWAIYSSSTSKVSALALQAIAIPIVYRSLGSHKYALYVLLSGVLASISLLQMGAGPGLTRELAQAHARQDRDHEASLFAGALVFSACAALVGSAVVLVVVRFVPSHVLFGASFASDHALIVRITAITALLLAAHVVFGVVDSALAGYQEQVFTGVGTTAANLMALLLLWIVCSVAPSITAVIVVLYGIPACARIVNLFLLLRRRPHLRSGLTSPKEWPIPILVHTGVAFWVVQLASMLEQNAGPFLLAHFSTAQAVNVFAIIFKIIGLLGTVAAIVTQPLWPSLTDALARHDVEWVWVTFRKIRIGLLSISIVIAIGMLGASDVVFTRLLGIAPVPQRALVVIFAVYLVANVWSHLHYVTLMGTSNLWMTAAVVIAENCIMLVCGAALVPLWGAWGMALAYLCASIILPMWLLPIMFARTLNKRASTAVSMALQPTA